VLKSLARMGHGLPLAWPRGFPKVFLSVRYPPSYEIPHQIVIPPISIFFHDFIHKFLKKLKKKRSLGEKPCVNARFFLGGGPRKEKTKKLFARQS
jgi:hypothetical protein